MTYVWENLTFSDMMKLQQTEPTHTF